MKHLIAWLSVLLLLLICISVNSRKNEDAHDPYRALEQVQGYISQALFSLDTIPATAGIDEMSRHIDDAVMWLEKAKLTSEEAY